ncbi:hypothetical protein ZIOFF_045920 [Zingiber officinale]|uniref:Response regulatory domain-containing protein n=1 Tax=Zingiber officinale TaxID=94328 RepID=A0A8J5G4M8_ZINOF|nr:hypothetical protein ZIOFF_045920 [Zingiber officinale]
MKPSTPFTVRAAANGLQAWEIIEDLSNHVDLVLTEVFLPGLCGVTLLSKIMSHKACKNIPVIMMSSNDSIEFLHKMCNGCGGSCSPPDNSSEARKESSTYNMISSSNAAPLKQGSNGSSNNNEMCTTTRKNSINNVTASSNAAALKPGSAACSNKNTMGSTMNVFTKPKSNKEETAFNYIRTTAVLHPKQIRTSTNQQIVHEKVQHHHHHHHHHHLHVHDMSQQLQSPDPDDLPPNMAAPASQCWSSNAFIEPFEGALPEQENTCRAEAACPWTICKTDRARKEQGGESETTSSAISSGSAIEIISQLVQLLLNMNKSSVSSKGNQIKAVNKNAAGNNSQVKHKIWGMKISEASIPVGFKSTFCQNRSHTTYGHEKAPQVSRIPCFT